MTAISQATEQRLGALDGWRAVSILCVLATHLVWLGPKAWQLNETAGPFGMSLFFTLSGFLITSNLLRHPFAIPFLVRRCFRILPLAWLFLPIALMRDRAAASVIAPHFLFYANIPPLRFTHTTEHFWSLCVEMQFYVGVSLLIALAGTRALYTLPLIGIAVTCNRIAHGEVICISTHFRVDEILAGCTLALSMHGITGKRLIDGFCRTHWLWLLIALAASSHPATGPLNYARPYLAAALVGSTLLRNDSWLSMTIQWRHFAYIAEISYALYVFHPLLADTWLGSGDGLVKYCKRPLLLLVLFGLSHLSTFALEHPCMTLGRRLASRWIKK